MPLDSTRELSNVLQQDFPEGDFIEVLSLDAPCVTHDETHANKNAETVGPVRLQLMCQSMSSAGKKTLQPAQCCFERQKTCPN
jgi:hypothetical protein